MDMVRLHIDNKEIIAKEGTLIIEAARRAGIEIPHFCYHPKLSIQGSCRMCLVEVEGRPKLVTSCTTPVEDKMVVRTGKTSKLVREAQEYMLAFFLINHPLDCPVCDKGGECPLQDYTYRYGPGKSPFPVEKWHFEKPVELSPFILIDRERCILCTRCIRFQEEIAYQPDLVLVDRGKGTYVDAPGPGGFSSIYSGNTIELCPVGALTSRMFRFKARPWELKRTPSICPHCGCGCNIHIDTRDGVVMRIVSRENPSVDDGWLCDRGRFGYAYVSSPERLKVPMIRRGDRVVLAPWDGVIHEVATRLMKIINTHGKDAVGGLVSSELTNEEMDMFYKFMKEKIGTINAGYFSHDHTSIDEGIIKGFREFSFETLEDADTLLLMGIDPLQELPILDLRIKKALKKGLRLFTVDTDRIELSRYAVSHRELKGDVDIIPVIREALANSTRFMLLTGKRVRKDLLEKVIEILKHFQPELKKRDGWISTGLMLQGANERGARDRGLHQEDPDAMWSSVRALIIAGEQMPSVEADGKPELLIVHAPFLQAIGEMADIVLPALVFSEKDGTFTNIEGRTQKLCKASNPPGESKSLIEVLTMISHVMEASNA